MSGTFPTTPAPEKVKITTVAPTLVSSSHNQTRQVRQRGTVHRWLLAISLPPNLTRAELAPLAAFLVAQRGQYETFSFSPPVLQDSRGIATGTPLIDGADQTGRSITTDGWTVSQTGIVKAGDLVSFAGHDKVYMITADADSDVSGIATLAIEPALFESPDDDAAITVNSVTFTVALVQDDWSFDLTGPLYIPDEIQLIEVP